MADDMAETSGITRRDVFRFAAASGITTAVGLGLGDGGPRAAGAGILPEPRVPPAEALQALRDGNARFVAHNLTSFAEDLNLINSGATETHEPFAAILSCADARVSPEIIFDQVMGDLFITRVAGNLATPEIIASIEYGVVVLGASLIMVVGHGRCGAVEAASAPSEVPGQISALFAPLRPAVVLGGTGGDLATRVDNRIRTNAQIQAIALRDSSPPLRERIDAGHLLVVPAYYDLVSGVVTELPLPPPVGP
jgi:carbonic anhydrase